MEKYGATVIASGVDDLPRSGSGSLRKFQYLKSYQNTRCVPEKGTGTLPERPKPYCRLPPKTGMCRAAVPSWYYIYSIYYILYTINYILYTIYYILYTINYIYLSIFLPGTTTQRKASASGSLGEDVVGTRTGSKQKRIACKLVEILQLWSMIAR